MPTRNWPALALQGIRCFLRQDYVESELIVVDDGADPLPAELPGGSRVRYFKVPPGMTLGAKRNFAAAQARGGILAQWDDEAWYGPRRLGEQAQPILDGQADLTVLQMGDSSEADPRTLLLDAALWSSLGGYPDVDQDDHAALLAKALERGARLRTLPAPAAPELPEDEQRLYRELAAAPPSRRPLVSCIMPTADRRPFVPQAIRRFLEQDYSERELLVLDDGQDAVADLIPPDPRIRYFRLAGQTGIGLQRNIGCRQARGELIAHWDDDDWMAPWRLTYQVRRLLESTADICGLDHLYFWDPARDLLWEYAYPAAEQPWVAGGTMLYRKSYWEQTPFPAVTVGEDNLFVWSAAPGKVLRLDDPRFYVATLHSRNTSPKYITPDRWVPRAPQEIAFMGAEKDWYIRLFRNVRREEQTPALAPAPARARGAPLVSCVMATGGRPRFVRQAIRCFLRQTYRNAELIVVDDGGHNVEELCQGLPPVRYVHADKGASLGAKLNLGIQQARGHILQKIDDDDYYHPHFLECAAGTLEAAEPARTIVAWDCFLVLLAGESQLRFSGHGWAAGGSLCFHRALWERTPFRDLPRAVDAGFLNDAQAGIRRVCAANLYLVVRHGRNTWTETDGAHVDEQFRRAPLCGVDLHQVVEPIDFPFYEALARGEAVFE